MLGAIPTTASPPGKTSTPKNPLHLPSRRKKERGKVTDEVPDFYSGEEVMSLYKVKQSWLYTTAKRNRISICRIAGKNYYSKHVDEFFGTAVDMDSITDWLLTEAEEQFGMKPATRAYAYRHRIPTKRIRPHLLLQVPSGRTPQNRPCERRALLHRGTGPADLRTFLSQHLPYRQG